MSSPGPREGQILLVCGTANILHCRELGMAEKVLRLLERLQPTLVVEGGAPGVDSDARGAALSLGIDRETHWANWKRHGKKAGMLRNQRMLDRSRPTQCVGLPGPSSRGTWGMVRLAQRAGIETWYVPVGEKVLRRCEG